MSHQVLVRVKTRCARRSSETAAPRGEACGRMHNAVKGGGNQLPRSARGGASCGGMITAWYLVDEPARRARVRASCGLAR